jgi:hypothetical protein
MEVGAFWEKRINRQSSVSLNTMFSSLVSLEPRSPTDTKGLLYVDLHTSCVYIYIFVHEEWRVLYMGGGHAYAL